MSPQSSQAFASPTFLRPTTCIIILRVQRLVVFASKKHFCLLENRETERENNTTVSRTGNSQIVITGPVAAGSLSLHGCKPPKKILTKIICVNTIFSLRDTLFYLQEYK